MRWIIVHSRQPPARPRSHAPRYRQHWWADSAPLVGSLWGGARPLSSPAGRRCKEAARHAAHHRVGRKGGARERRAPRYHQAPQALASPLASHAWGTARDGTIRIENSGARTSNGPCTSPPLPRAGAGHRSAAVDQRRGCRPPELAAIVKVAPRRTVRLQESTAVGRAPAVAAVTSSLRTQLLLKERHGH